MYRRIFIVLAITLGAAGVACQPQSPSEKAADHLEDAGDELEAAGEDAVETMQEAGDDVAEKVEDTCEEVKEGAGATDTDC